MELIAETDNRAAAQPAVLVVADSRPIRQTLVGILSQSGYLAEGACDGVDRLARARAPSPCVAQCADRAVFWNGD